MHNLQQYDDHQYEGPLGNAIEETILNVLLVREASSVRERASLEVHDLEIQCLYSHRLFVRKWIVWHDQSQFQWGEYRISTYVVEHLHLD